MIEKLAKSEVSRNMVSEKSEIKDYEDIFAREKKRDIRPKKEHYRCLKCDRLFRPDTIFNRLCMHCRTLSCCDVLEVPKFRP